MLLYVISQGVNPVPTHNTFINHTQFNNNQALVPKFWDRLWILYRLVKISHMYCFPPFYSILELFYLWLP